MAVSRVMVMRGRRLKLARWHTDWAKEIMPSMMLSKPGMMFNVMPVYGGPVSNTTTEKEGFSHMTHFMKVGHMI